jgi:hypothetical protein
MPPNEHPAPHGRTAADAARPTRQAPRPSPGARRRARRWLQQMLEHGDKASGGVTAIQQAARPGGASEEGR